MSKVVPTHSNEPMWTILLIKRESKYYSSREKVRRTLNAMFLSLLNIMIYAKMNKTGCVSDNNKITIFQAWKIESPNYRNWLASLP